MSIFKVFSRAVAGGIFIAEGFDALTNTQEHLDRLDSVQPLLDKVNSKLDIEPTQQHYIMASKATALVCIASSACLIFGKAPRFNAAVLAGIGAMNILLRYPFWTGRNWQDKQAQLKRVFRNATLVTTALLLATDTNGKPNAAWRRHYKEQIRTLKQAAKASKA